MTVKELKEILDKCSDDATITIQGIAGWDNDGVACDIFPSQIWETDDGEQVVLDPTFGEER